MGKITLCANKKIKEEATIENKTEDADKNVKEEALKICNSFVICGEHLFTKSL